MNSLLKHQVNKYLSNKNVSNEDLMAFIDAVNRSYENFDDQYLMQQRAMAISSEELVETNQRLKQETLIQSNLIDKLNNVIETLKLHELSKSKGQKKETLKMDGLQLAEFIDKQTKDIVEMNEQREKLLNTLEAQNQELSDYAYLVSHDLKSPLRSIDALTTWLNQEVEENDSGSASENLKLIRNNVEKMDNLISGILNYSTINKNQSEVCDLSVNKIIDEILLSVSVPDNIIVNIAPNLPVINGDKYRIKQLFENLIDNAIKHIDKEKGLLQVGFLEKPTHWQFYVRDNGVGIEKAYFDKVFKPFQKLENNPKATGIGLSICKKIVNAYEGDIWLESELGKGSIFHFTLKK